MEPERIGSSRDGLVVGGGSVLFAWVAAVVGALCNQVDPAIEFVGLDRADLRDDLGRSEGPSRVFVCHHPGQRVMEALRQRTMRVIAVLDDPVDSVRYLRFLGHGIIGALRDQTSAAAANHLFIDNPSVRFVYRGQALARDVVRTLVDHLALPVPDDLLATTLDRFGGPASEPWSLETALVSQIQGYLPLDRLNEDVSGDEATLVRQVLSPMILGAIRSDITPIVWPRQVFLFGDMPGEPVPEEVDIAGGARNIYYGPYFHLPPGFWTVRFVLGFSHDARDTSFFLVVRSGALAIARVLLKPTSEGAFEGTFTMEHDNPERQVEIQLGNYEGSIAGRIRLGELSFTRVNQPSAVQAR